MRLISVFGVLKNLTFIKLLKMPRNKQKKLKPFVSLSVYQRILLSKSSFKWLIFAYLNNWTPTYEESLVVFYYLHGKFADCIIRLLFCTKFFTYCRFPNIFIQVVSPNSWVERSRLLPTFKAWLLSTCLFFFQCQRNFNFMVCFVVIILKNRIERAF